MDHAVPLSSIAREARDPDCLDPRAATARLRPVPWRRLLVLGDSVAAGVREPLAGYRDACFADRIAEILADGRSDFAYANLGQRDLTAAEVLQRQIPAGLAFAPDLAIVVALKRGPSPLPDARSAEATA